MASLLIVLVSVCALASAAHLGRGMWARTRSVERHQRALDRLADITQSVEAKSPFPQEEIAGPVDHQAHVRLIGPSGPMDASPAVLPPPRPLGRAPQTKASPLRRPSPGRSSQVAPASPPRPLGQPYDAGEATLPGSPLPEGEPPTRPVPAVRPNGLYFDDLGAPQPPPPGAARLERSPARVRALAAAALIVAFAAAAAAFALARAPARGTPQLRASPPTQPAAALRPTVTTTTAPPTTTTTRPALPAQPAVWLRTASGTATYQLTAASASIVLTATGPCWIEVRVGTRAGPVFYQGTLEAGGISKVTGPAWIRLGNPVNAHVAVNGATMPIPGAIKAVPLNLQFTLG